MIGQTWDWAQRLEGHFVVMEIQFPSGHKLTQLTEAGIIGKIGFNNCGLGVTLNIF
jgi:isopenicillin-N N-acyltransferase-like protein